MKVKKTIKAKIVELTNIKKEQLEKEYSNLQRFLQGEKDVKLYSANKQQAKRFYKKIKPGKEYPLSIRKDLIKVEKRDTKIANYWVRIPVKARRGGLWLAIKPHCEIEDDFEIGESKVKKHKGNFFIHIAVQKEVSDIQIPKNPPIISCDLGEKHIVTSVEFANGSIKNPKFYGDGVRGLRRHYSWLRKRLGNKKLLKKIREIKHTEKRKVNDSLHKISRAIVNEAKEKNVVIVLGDLKGIRKSVKGKGRRFNRIVSNRPYYKLTQYITYKAEWEGVGVYQISEKNTSKICHVCGQKGKRVTQGLFKCPNCDLEYNADLNGAINIAKRFSEQCLENGAVLVQPITSPLS